MRNIRLLAALLLALWPVEASAANRFIVNDAAGCTTHNWIAGCFGTSSGSGATPGLPIAGDTLFCDASSGTTNPTFTVNATPASLASVNFTSCSLTNFDDTGNFNFTITTTFTCATTSTAIKFGSSTWDFTVANSASNTIINITCTPADIVAGTSTILVDGAMLAGGNRSIIGGGATFATISAQHGIVTIGGSNTVASLQCSNGGMYSLTSGTTQTVSGTVISSGSSASGNQCLWAASLPTVATINQTAGSNVLSWAGVRGITFTGGAAYTWNNSFDLGGNTFSGGSTGSFSAPTGGGGGYVF